MMRARLTLWAGEAKIISLMSAHNAEKTLSGSVSRGRLMALDLGARRVGIAISDELRVAIRRLPAIERQSWKAFLNHVKAQIETHQVSGLVIGLPLNMDGTEGPAAEEARQTADKFRLSLDIPIYLVDERLTTEEAKEQLHLAGMRDINDQLDSAAAAVILQDFLSHAN